MKSGRILQPKILRGVFGEILEFIKMSTLSWVLMQIDILEFCEKNNF